MAAPPSSPRVRALARELRQLREDRNISQRELARRLGISNAALSYWEGGQRVPDVNDDVIPILDELRVVGAERERILELARNASLTSNWLAPGIPDLSPALAGVLDCEATATEIVQWSLSVPPGLLQTEATARAILGDDALVRLRMARQRILTRKHPATYRVFMHECALREVITTRTEHFVQLWHIKETAALPNVHVRVVRQSKGWHPGLLGSFIVYNFPDAPSIIHLEHHQSSAFLYKDRDVKAYKTAVDKIRGVAMSPEESAELIAEVMEDMEMR